MNKGEVCKMLEGVGALEHGRYDTALPQGWVDEMDKLGVDSRFSFVWDYSKDRVFGKPVDISTLFVKHFGENAKTYIYKEKSNV